MVTGGIPEATNGSLGIAVREIEQAEQIGHRARLRGAPGAFASTAAIGDRSEQHLRRLLPAARHAQGRSQHVEDAAPLVPGARVVEQLRGADQRLLALGETPLPHQADAALDLLTGLAKPLPRLAAVPFSGSHPNLVYPVPMDTLGIIRQLETDPGLRSQLRAVILGDEVLELPEVVRGLEARLETLTVRVEELAGRMETLAVRVEELAGRMETLATHMDALARAQARTEVRLDVLRGDAYERRVRENAAAILGTAAGGLRSIHVVPQGELADLLDEAVDAERLTGAERNDVLRADFVARALRRSDRQEVFVVAEASISPDANDADRAGRRAATVSRGLGRAAIPIVVATSGSQSSESWAVEVVRFDFPAVA